MQNASQNAPGNHTFRWKEFTWWIALTILFAITYAQSPLYTSNQNQYFLHGLARAGLGNLSQDWLANTLDPTPVFSLLVEWAYRLTHAPVIFLILYALLMGIYLFSLVSISDHLFDLRRTPGAWLVFAILLMLIHSAALRFGFTRLLGEVWAYLLEDGVAGQRLLGPVFQPSVFGILLLVSIYLFLKRRPYLAILAAALSATLHPTYLLSSAALTLSYVLVTFQEGHRAGGGFWKSLAKSMTLGLVALFAVAPILSYVYCNFANTPAETSAEARAILVNFRIPHHALISNWFNATVVIKLVIIIIGIVLARRTRLFWVMLAPFLIAVALTAFQAFSRSDVLALLFPWRISAFLVPLASALIIAWLLANLIRRYPNFFSRYRRWVRVSCIAALGLVTIAGIYRSWLEFQAKEASPERFLYSHVSTNIIPGQVYLAPIQMQDFRLETGAPVFVDFKSIPYQDADVLEWKRRITQANRVYNLQDCAALENMQTSGVTHLVLPVDKFDVKCEGMELTYQDPAYRIYILR